MKKGAISLPANTLVIIIISLFILTGIIVFISKLMTPTKENYDQIKDQLIKEMTDITCEPYKKLCVYPTNINEFQKKFIVSAKVNNQRGELLKLKFHRKIINLNNQDNQDNQNNQYCGAIEVLPQDDYEINIPPGASLSLPILVIMKSKANCVIKVSLTDEQQNQYAKTVIFVNTA